MLFGPSKSTQIANLKADLLIAQGRGDRLDAALGEAAARSADRDELLIRRTAERDKALAERDAIRAELDDMRQAVGFAIGAAP